MPFELSWYQPDRIALMTLKGVLTPDEALKIVDTTTAMLFDSQATLHFLIDTRTLEKIENIPGVLKSVQAAPIHPNMGWMIVVGKMNPMVKFALDFVGLLTKSRYRHVDSMPEALSFLKEIDGTVIQA